MIQWVNHSEGFYGALGKLLGDSGVGVAHSSSQGIPRMSWVSRPIPTDLGLEFLTESVTREFQDD